MSKDAQLVKIFPKLYTFQDSLQCSQDYITHCSPGSRKIKTILTYLHIIHFNTNLPNSHRPLYLPLSFWFSNLNTFQESPLLCMPHSPPTLPSFNLIILIFGKQCTLWSSSLCNFPAVSCHFLCLWFTDLIPLFLNSICLWQKALSSLNKTLITCTMIYWFVYIVLKYLTVLSPSFWIQNSLQCSQNLTSGSDREPDNSCPHRHSLLPHDT